MSFRGISVFHKWVTAKWVLLIKKFLNYFQLFAVGNRQKAPRIASVEIQIRHLFSFGGSWPFLAKSENVNVIVLTCCVTAILGQAMLCTARAWRETLKASLSKSYSCFFLKSQLDVFQGIYIIIIPFLKYLILNTTTKNKRSALIVFLPWTTRKKSTHEFRFSWEFNICSLQNKLVFGI